MRFMAIMYPGPDAERGITPDTNSDVFVAMGNFNEELVKAGVMLAGEALHPSSKGARIRYADGKPQVSDGPFTETKEIIGGFWLLQCKSKEEAVEWLKRAPCPNGEMIELRQVYEMEDFGDVMTPELREQEERLRAELTSKG
jgi:hypothetical protein